MFTHGRAHWYCPYRGRNLHVVKGKRRPKPSFDYELKLMNISKPYRPRNQRLDKGLYEQAGSVTFITISALRPACPFTNNELNAAIINTLRELQSVLGCAIFGTVSGSSAAGLSRQDALQVLSAGPAHP